MLVEQQQQQQPQQLQSIETDSSASSSIQPNDSCVSDDSGHECVPVTSAVVIVVDDPPPVIIQTEEQVNIETIDYRPSYRCRPIFSLFTKVKQINKSSENTKTMEDDKLKWKRVWNNTVSR